MAFGPYDFLMDFSLMSILLFIAQLLRSKIKLLQILYIPASLIAGFLGLFGGPQFLNIIPFSASASSYAYMLVVVLFASLFIGNSEKSSIKKVVNEVGDTFTLNMAAEFFHFGTALLVGVFVLSWMFPTLQESFAILLPSGFCGGHGYAAAIGGTLEKGGFEGAVTIGQTFATIGLLVGVIGGIIIINYATRVGATRLVKSASQLPEGMRTGMIAPGEQQPMGNATTSPMAIDPLAWHVALVLVATAGGYYATNALQAWAAQYISNISIPMMSVAMLVGVVLQGVLRLTKTDKYVDKQIVTRVGSTVSDYLVCFGVATIRISIVIEYAMPILVMCLFGIALVLAYLFFVSRKLFHNFWFERGIFIYGWTTGVVAIGVTLLRVVDPEFKSGALQDYGTAYVFIAIVEVFLVSVTPVLLLQGFGLATGLVLVAIAAALLIATAVKYGVNKQKMHELRPGEKEVIEAH